MSDKQLAPVGSQELAAPIKQYVNEINYLAEEEMHIPLVAKIRLGQRVEGNSKRAFPDGKYEYFFLTDPGTGPNEYHTKIIEKYGDKPVALPVRFMSPEIGEMIPSAYMWYKAGLIRKDGSVEGGILNCRGNGPHADGTPGEAKFYGQKDPITRIIPSRECLGKDCEDYKDRKGSAQCKPVMKVVFMMPDCVLGGMIHIDTSSMHSMRQFRQILSWALKVPLLRDNWSQVPWVIYRKKVKTSYWDAGKGKEMSGIAYPMFLKFDEITFARLVTEGKIGQGSQGRLSANVNMDEMPVEDHFEAFPEEAAVNRGPDASQAIMNDPEIEDLFNELERVSGKKYSTKARLLAIRSKKGDDVKGQVARALKDSISKFMVVDASPAAEPTPTQPTPTEAVQPPDPAPEEPPLSKAPTGGIL